MTSHYIRGPAAGRTQRDHLEQILKVVPGTTPAQADALLALFSPAADPIHSGALAGEAAAVAAFRAAHRQPAPATRRAAMLGSLAALLTVKTVAAALAVTSLGGVALAATTGVLPTALSAESQKAQQGSAQLGRDAAADASAKGLAKAAAVQEAAKAAAAADRSHGQADRSASYAGLCEAFAAGAWDNGKAAASPAFSRLITAAPEGNIADFCSALALQDPAEDANASDATESATAAKAKAAAPRDKTTDNAKAGQERAEARGEMP